MSPRSAGSTERFTTCRGGARRLGHPPAAQRAPGAGGGFAELDQLQGDERVERAPGRLVPVEQIAELSAGVEAVQQRFFIGVEPDVLESVEGTLSADRVPVGSLAEEAIDFLHRQPEAHAVHDEVGRARLQEERIGVAQTHALREVEASRPPGEDLEELLFGLVSQRHGEVLLVEHVHRDQDLTLRPFAAIHPLNRLVQHVRGDLPGGEEQVSQALVHQVRPHRHRMSFLDLEQLLLLARLELEYAAGAETVEMVEQ